MKDGRPLVVSYGGGVNSAAMLVGFYEKQVQPDLILFADTGSEKPETYSSLEEWGRWCADCGMPPITRVSVADNPNAVAKSLEEQCLRLGFLPSIAYGYKTCSQRWKADPIRKFMTPWQPAIDEAARGRKVLHAIGYDIGESHRSIQDDPRSEFFFPLREWGWDRKACVAAIERNGMPVPPKSACFFCPSSKKSEILRLKREHPDLFARAVAIEHAAKANSTSVKGLGRNWSWEQLVQIEEAQQKLFHDVVPMPCMCFDGEEDDE